MAEPAREFEAALFEIFPGGARRPLQLATCHCTACTNVFFFIYLPEHQPKCCAYCGKEFWFYKDHEGRLRNLNGLARDDQPPQEPPCQP